MYERIQVVDEHQDAHLEYHSLDLQQKLNCDCDTDEKLEIPELQDQAVVLFDSVVED